VAFNGGEAFAETENNKYEKQLQLQVLPFALCSPFNSSVTPASIEIGGFVN